MSIVRDKGADIRVVIVKMREEFRVVVCPD
jgi:hypothetical protein